MVDRLADEHHESENELARISKESVDFFRKLQGAGILPPITLPPILNSHAEKGILWDPKGNAMLVAQLLADHVMVDGKPIHPAGQLRESVDFYFPSGVPGVSARQRMIIKKGVSSLSYIYTDILPRDPVLWSNGLYQAAARAENHVIIRHDVPHDKRHLNWRYLRKLATEHHIPGRDMTYIIYKKSIGFIKHRRNDWSDKKEFIGGAKVCGVEPFIDIAVTESFRFDVKDLPHDDWMLIHECLTHEIMLPHKVIDLLKDQPNDKHLSVEVECKGGEKLRSTAADLTRKILFIRGGPDDALTVERRKGE